MPADAARRRRGRAGAAPRVALLGGLAASTGCLPAQPSAALEPAPPAAATASGGAIAIDFPTVPPPARDEVRASEGLGTLRTPLGIEAATATLKAFFRAVLDESSAALGSVVTADAQIQDLPDGATVRAGQPVRSREALSFWAQRFRQREYGRLAGELVFRDSDVEVFRTGAMDRLPVSLSAVASETLGRMGPTDLLLRVPILTGSVRSEQLFGREIYLWLRRAGDRYVIYHLAEPLPF